MNGVVSRLGRRSYKRGCVYCSQGGHSIGSRSRSRLGCAGGEDQADCNREGCGGSDSSYATGIHVVPLFGAETGGIGILLMSVRRRVFGFTFERKMVPMRQPEVVFEGTIPA